MNKIAIIGDSTCDLTPELRKEYDIDYCRMIISWKDKDGKDVETFASLDWEVISHKDYFNMLASGVRIITAQVTEQEYDLVFKKHLDAGQDILYISCSSALSASVLLAQRLVAEKYSKEYPDRKIAIVDPLNSCMGQGSMLIKAREMANDGISLDNIANYLLEHRLEYNQVATVENLDTLKRAGRVKASSAFFGNLFGVKPILISDAKGNNYAIEKQKGRRNALLRCVEMVKQSVVNPKEQTLWISEAECKSEDLDLLIGKLKEEIPFKEIRVVPMGPIIGGTTGKGTVGLYFVGKKVEVVGN